VKRQILILCAAMVVFATAHPTQPSDRQDGMIELKVMRVNVDPLAGQSVVILEDMDEKKAIPIWIGISEANAIAMEINGFVPPRPMTHDLIKSILEGLHARLRHIVIHDVRENIIYASIVLDLRGQDIAIDARPSDAIALAVRVKAPIFVTVEVYQNLSIDLKKDGGEGPELSASRSVGGIRAA
jgi:bifunctional DNase/RNase